MKYNKQKLKDLFSKEFELMFSLFKLLVAIYENKDFKIYNTKSNKLYVSNLSNKTIDFSEYTKGELSNNILEEDDVIKITYNDKPTKQIVVDLIKFTNNKLRGNDGEKK